MSQRNQQDEKPLTHRKTFNSKPPEAHQLRLPNPFALEDLRKSEVLIPDSEFKKNSLPRL